MSGLRKAADGGEHGDATSDLVDRSAVRHLALAVAELATTRSSPRGKVSQVGRKAEASSPTEQTCHCGALPTWQNGTHHSNWRPTSGRQFSTQASHCGGDGRFLLAAGTASRDGAELKRMVSEKVAAARAGTIAAQTETMRIASRALTGKKTPHAATAVVAAALKPALRTVKANAKRLGKKRGSAVRRQK